MGQSAEQFGGYVLVLESVANHECHLCLPWVAKSVVVPYGDERAVDPDHESGAVHAVDAGQMPDLVRSEDRMRGEVAEEARSV
jgi:hypothetical protein